MRPGGDGINRKIDSAVTLLPQPLSPTMARVSPGGTANETPSTARTTPSRVKNQVRRSAISRIGVGRGFGAMTTPAAGSAIAYMRRARRGSSASRSPSPRRFIANTVADRKAPGNSTM